MAYYASAELGCFLALGWPMPARILDLFAEFRASTNGLSLPCGAGLLGALQRHGLDAMAADEKTAMRDLVLRGGPWSEEERRAILDYCQADVDALAALLPKILPSILSRQRDAGIALGQALLRGRYMAAAARIEWAGVPIDTVMLHRLRTGWGGIKARLVEDVDARYGVYEGISFKADRFAAYLVAEGIPWPRLTSGVLALGDDTFRDQAKTWPALQPLRELRHALGELRLEALAVGLGRAQPLSVIGLQLTHWPQSAQQQQVHLRPGDLAALADPARARHGPGLRRLQLAGDGHRRRALRRSGA